MRLIDQKSISAGEYSPRFRPDTPFLIEGCMVLRCMKGSASFRLDFRDYLITAGNVVFLINDMVIELGGCSDDFEVRYVSVPAPQLVEIYISVTSNKFWDALYLSPVRRFGKRYSRAIDSCIEECLFVADVCTPQVSAKVIPKVLLSMFMVMEDLVSQDSAEIPPQFTLSPWKIVGEFFALLSRYYTTEHKVAFYADALNITPDYLGVVTKEWIGITPKETIETKLVLAMKALLESTALSVKNIADRLHYDDSSHLCKVFRRHTGFSPGQYRRRRK